MEATDCSYHLVTKTIHSLQSSEGKHHDNVVFSFCFRYGNDIWIPLRGTETANCSRLLEEKRERGEKEEIRR